MSITLIMPCILVHRRLPMCCCDSPELECNSNGHDNRHRLSIEQRWCKTPLPHGFDRRGVEQRLRAQHANITHRTVFGNHRLEDDKTVDTCGSCEWWVDRSDVDNFLRRFDAASGADDWL